MSTCALTSATSQRRAIFACAANAELLVDILFKYRDQGRYLLHAFAVMPDHVHVLLTPAIGQTVERCAQCIKGGFSFKHGPKRSGEIWQRGFHEHRVRDASDFKNQIEYIAKNPERRSLIDFVFVHTHFADRIDPMPSILGSPLTSTKACLRG